MKGGWPLTLRRSSRVLTTVLFTDIVASTQIAAELGDRRFKVLVARHNAIVRRQLKGLGGREIDTAGDGFLASFPTPERGVRCAAAIVDAVREIGLEVRAGLHFGEVEQDSDHPRGIAVAVGARIAALASTGEVLVSSTVAEVVRGSEIRLEDRGSHALKGVGDWLVFAVSSIDGQAVPPPLAAEEASRRRASVQEQRDGRRRITRAVLLAALALTAVGVVATVGLRAGGRRAGGQSSPGESRSPSAQEERLLSLLPASFASGCVPTSERPPHALAAADCDLGEVQARYTLFDTAPSMDDWFEGSVAIKKAPPGDCGRDRLAVDAWSTQQIAHGRVLCYRERAASGVEWTDERFLVTGRASRGDQGDLNLYRWWLLRAGPWQRDGERRDGDASIARFPEGRYRMRIKLKDRSLVPPGTFSAVWVGVWTLRVEGGNFSVVASGNSTRGSYVYGKGGGVLLYPADSPECAVDPVVLKWSVHGDRLLLDYPVLTFCGDTSHYLPLDLHPWRRVA